MTVCGASSVPCISTRFPLERDLMQLLEANSRRSPWQNGFAERLIGSIRRECLDQIIVCGEEHLRRTLLSYASYYNRTRTHRSLNKDAPVHRPI